MVSGIGIDYDATGVIRAFAGASERAIDVTKIADDIALIIQSDVDERFNTSPGVEQGGAVYGGESWDRVTESYLNQRTDRRGGQLLRDTGELLQSFTIGGSGNVLEKTKNSVTFGSSLEKARGLNKKRPMIFAHPELVENVASVWEAYILGDLI